MKTPLFQLVLLAGGLGTRLRPFSATTPKSLVQIQGKPFILHQLELLYQQGIHEIVVCLGYLGDQILSVLRHYRRDQLRIQLSQEGESLLGTAGAIKQAFPLLKDYFFVLYGDAYLTCSYATVQQAFMDSHALALMTVFKNNNRWDKSNVVLINQQITVYDKQQWLPTMQHIDYGLSIFNKQAFAQFVPNDSPYDLASLQQQLLQQGQLAAWEVTERFYEIGSWAGIQALEHYLQAAEPVSTEKG